jgi:RNA polymerase sigma-70 factor (ECF subfamily)
VDADDAERALLQDLVEAHEAGDTDRFRSLLTQDVRATMPPMPMVFDGLAAMEPLFERAFGPDGGQWRLLATRANRMPATASYWREGGDGPFRPFKLDVYRVVDGRVAEVTTFGAGLFEAFRLPGSL